MAGTDPITELDLYGRPQEEAARRARARAAALLQQQYVAGLAMQNERPEMQKLGEAEFGQAGREGESIRDMGSRVLATTLAKERNDIARISAERELAALQQQIQFQNAQMALQNRQFGEAIRQHGWENIIQAYNSYLSGLKQPSPELQKQESQLRQQVAGTEATIGKWGPLGKTISGLLTKGPEAKAKEVKQLIKESGARTEPPLSLMEFASQLGAGGGALPPSKLGAPTPPSAVSPGAGVSAAVPQAAGAGGGLTAGTPAAAQGPQLPAPGPDGRIPIKRKGVPGRVKPEKFDPSTDELTGP